MSVVIRRKSPCGILASILLVSVGPAALAADPPWIARSRAGMVASDSPEASRIGAEVLKAGGNAFDAAVATSLALAVTRPQSTGLGGGGFMVAYDARTGRFVALDFRETAPASATPKRYADLAAKRGDGPSPSVFGGNAIGVPGQLAGLEQIRRRFGTRPLAELVRPARALARRGFEIDTHYVDSCRAVQHDLRRWPGLAKIAAGVMPLVRPGEAPPTAGMRLKRPGLARALGLIARRGPEALYGGEIGEAIVKAVDQAGGRMTLDDLRGYRVIERTPIRGAVFVGGGGYEIVSMPPPSSGGVCLLEALNIMEAASDGARGALFAQRRSHLLVEAMKHAFADRARWLGDPGFADIPVDRLTGKQYAAMLADRLDPGRTQPPERYGSGRSIDDHGTSHFCVWDAAGNVVALTETINGLFGSLVVAEPFGIVLNNEMDDFLTVPGKANMFGLRQSEANLVGPGKRPLSSMSPTIVLEGGRPVLAIGAAGGPRIISSVLNVMLHVLEGQTLEQALTAPRLHHQWQPDQVVFDRPPPADVVAQLAACGHRLGDRRRGGVVQAIRRLADGTLVGASDPKKGGRPAAAD